jgi:hypothetical protein
MKFGVAKRERSFPSTSIPRLCPAGRRIQTVGSCGHRLGQYRALPLRCSFRRKALEIHHDDLSRATKFD